MKFNFYACLNYKDLLKIFFWATFTLLYSPSGATVGDAEPSVQHSKIFHILCISEDFSDVLKKQVTECTSL